MKKSTLRIIAAILVVLSLLAFYFLYIADISIIIRVVAAFAIVIAVGLVLQKFFGLKGSWSLYMVGSKRGLNEIEKISKKYGKFWDAMAMWGLTLGFGLLAYPLMKGKIDKRVFAFGMISLAVIMFLVLPYISYGFQFINISQIQNAVSASKSSSTGLTPLNYIIYGATIIAGFSGSIIVSLFINTESILYSIVLFLQNPSLGAAASGITSQVPGVAPIIPGIDIPLIAGIISLVILLMVHEFSHGILARKAKVKLKSIGLLLFGFIPIGGYVEPDEKMVEKLDNVKQTKIFAAGISANFIAMLVFFVLLLLIIVYVAPSAYQYKVVVAGTYAGYPANGILKSGMQVLEWNGHSIKNISSLTEASATDRPNSTVTVVTNTGTYSIKTVADPQNATRGLIGVTLNYEPVIATPYARIVYFLYTVFALSMLLNFLVAVVNLLPLPGLDGWRIYYANIKNERIAKTLGAFVILMIIINILPWLFYL